MQFVVDDYADALARGDKSERLRIALGLLTMIVEGGGDDERVATATAAEIIQIESNTGGEE